MTAHSKEYWLDKIHTSLSERYAKEPCSEDKLMREADQFEPLIWEVYGLVGIKRDDILKIAREIVR